MSLVVKVKETAMNQKKEEQMMGMLDAKETLFVEATTVSSLELIIMTRMIVVKDQSLLKV